MKKWICTASGRVFDLQHPTPDMVDLGDIAHALAHLCRFTGHCRRHYSVAEHSVRVSWLVSGDLRLPSLLHDAAEAYMGDWSSPLKAMIREEAPGLVERIEGRIEAAIAERFGFDPALLHHPEIKRADRVMYATEKRDIMPPDPITDEVFGEFPKPLAHGLGADVGGWRATFKCFAHAYGVKP